MTKLTTDEINLESECFNSDFVRLSGIRDLSKKNLARSRIVKLYLTYQDVITNLKQFNRQERLVTGVSFLQVISRCSIAC